MASYLDLLNVQFIDATSHAQTSGSDPLGMWLLFPWGPVRQNITLDRSEFFGTFPESLPPGVKFTDFEDPNHFDGYAQVKQFFNNGGKKVEIFRPHFGCKYLLWEYTNTAGIKYQVGFKYPGLPLVSQVGESLALAVKITDSMVGLYSVSNEGHFNKVEEWLGQWENETATDLGQYTHFMEVLKSSSYLTCWNESDPSCPESGDIQAGASITGEYQVILPTLTDTITNFSASIATNILTIASIELTIGGTATAYTDFSVLKAAGYGIAYTNDGVWNTGNAFTATVTGDTSYVSVYRISDGKLIGIGKVAAAATTILASDNVDPAVICGTKYVMGPTPTTPVTGITYVDYDAISGGGTGCPFEDSVEKAFGDMDTSNCSMIVSPTTDPGLNAAINTLCEARMTMVFIEALAENVPFDKASVKSELNDHAINYPRGKFVVPVHGAEYLKMFGSKYTLNCAGGVAGAYAKVAAEKCLNQIASARTYGSYVGNLYKFPNFGNVLDSHELGVVTVYKSNKGPQIFGVHNAQYLDKPNSYFSTTNVSRVVTAILRDIFPLALDAIHTDVAANPITRQALNQKCNAIINNHIAFKNLQNDSEVLMTDAMNTDILTYGGKQLNMLIKCHFIGLTERVNIKVVATDSSVTADITTL